MCNPSFSVWFVPIKNRSMNRFVMGRESYPAVPPKVYRFIYTAVHGAKPSRPTYRAKALRSHVPVCPRAAFQQMAALFWRKARRYSLPHRSYLIVFIISFFPCLSTRKTQRCRDQPRQHADQRAGDDVAVAFDPCCAQIDADGVEDRFARAHQRGGDEPLAAVRAVLL